MNRRHFILTSLALGLSLFLFPELRADEAAKPIKILMVANSFGLNVSTYFSGFAKEGGQAPTLLVTMKAGCSLQEHAAGLTASATSPESPQAQIYSEGWFTPKPAGFPKKYTLIDALKADKWDYVTIQQASFLSYKPESYEPYAKQVVDAIRQYAPQAEILVHETWAYREDDSLFKKGDFTRDQMYEGLKAAYAKLASDYHLRIIPTGDAFQAARATERWHYVPDTHFDFAHPAEGSLPNQPGSLNMGWKSTKDRVTGKPVFVLDAHHANEAGKYLAGAVMYETLTGVNVEKFTYCPKGLDPIVAAELRRIAHETVQAKKSAEGNSVTVAK